MTSKISENSTSQNSPKADVASQTREVTWGTPFPQITVIVFSKDRPLQLDGTLRSFFARCQDADRCQTKVLYRASAEYQPLYDALIREYPSVGFVAEHDFHSDLLKLLSVSEAVLFVVDDNMFIRNFTATEMVDALRDHPQAVGFSMRLGRNTTFCYPLNKTQALPSFETVTPQILSYDWTKADCDFNYPLEVSSSVYRSADVLQLLREMPFRNPNTLEGEFAGRAPRFQASHPRLLCFDLSRAFCNPINLVQTECQNRVGGESDHLPERLAQQFRAGARLDVAIYFNFIPTGCHQEVSLHFIEGNQPPPGPAVSVIIPCYKQAHYLPESVQSVLDQTFTDWELIIVNDGSPDDTAEVARELAARHSDKKIVVLTQPNGGLSSARNAGMRAALGRYLLPLDADDKLTPEFLHETVAVLDQHSEISVAYTDLQCFEGSNEMISKGDFGRNLMLENSVAYCALLRREVWEAVGGYNPNMSAGYEDWDFWVGAVEREFRGHRIAKSLFLYRVRVQSMIATAMQRHRELVSRIVLNHPRLYDEPSRNLAGELLLANPLPAARAQAAHISVVIPCYKQARFLPESVASVVAQTCQNWEIIIVNDGSPDDTSVVAAQLIQKHPGRISLLEKANGGLSSARNAGIRAAQGEYIFLLDADDRIQPTMLEKTRTVLDTQPKVGFAYTHIQHFGALNDVFPLPDFDRATLISKDNIVCGNCLVRKAAWQQAGGYNELMREGYEDWDFWIGCVEQGWEGFCIREPLFCYRKSATSMLSDANQKRERLIATIVSNHPGLYNAQTRAWADDVLRKASDQAESASRNVQSLASLRVTYLISSILGVTGGNQTLLRQADELQRRGHDVTIVTYTPKPDWFTFKMRVVQVPSGQAMAPHVPPSDVVISTYFINTHELLAVKAAVKVYYAQGDQFVFADTTLADSPENRRWRELSRESYLLPQVRFVPNSHNLARAVENMTGRKPDGLLPVCTDQTLFRPLQRSLPGSRVRILIVGPDMRGSSAEPLLFKGIQDIHDALLVVTKRHPNFTAVRMSGSPPEIFQRFPCEFYVAPSDEMKTVLFGTADILIYASHYDSCPRPPQEAMASGCAVVCTATPGAMEYCRDGENCLLVPIQSPQAIADATLRLIEDRALRERLVQGGLATARKYPRELEWNELETMLRRFVEEAKNASTPATTSQALQPAQPTQRPKAAAGKPITLPEAALLGDLLAARTALRDKELVGAWRLGGEAIEQRPFHPSGWIFLSEVANKAGHRSLARRCAQKAVALTPNWKQAKRALSAIGSGPDKPTVALAEPPLREGLPPRLSVCLIAKNEERFLDGCLQSIRGLADQVILVDTGSTDRTVEIARNHGAEVHFRTWDDDFSAARNAALLHARGDWVLILDADEEVSPAHHAALRALLTRPNAIAYRLPMVDVGREADGVSQVPRLFRNAPQQFYVSRIHEQVYASLELNREKWSMENLFGDAQLIHHGYQAEVVKSRDKIQRNLRLLEQANEEYPNDVNLLMNLGLELWRSGQQNYGLGYYQQAYTAMLQQPYAQTPPELREVLLTQYASHLLTLQLSQEVVGLFHDQSVAPKDRTASQHFILGLAHSALQRWEPCATHLQQCLNLRNQPALTPIHQDIRSATPAHCLAHALRKLGRKAEAKTAFEQALQDDPLNESARVEFAAFQADEGQIIPALTLLHAGIEQNPKQAKVWEAGGALSLRQRDTLEFALDWSSEALKHLPNHPTLQRQRAETLLLNGHVHEALPLWSEVSQSNDAASSSGLILCRLFAGESQSALPPDREVAVSQDLIRRYRQSVEMGLDGWVNALHQRVDTLRQTLPSAARLIDQVVAESGPEK